jgi:hypothetical protein
VWGFRIRGAAAAVMPSTAECRQGILLKKHMTKSTFAAHSDPEIMGGTPVFVGARVSNAADTTIRWR